MSGLSRDLARFVLRHGGVEVRRLEDGAWLLQRCPGRLSVRQVGARGLHTHVIADPETVDHNMSGYLKRMGHLLGEQHLAWILGELGVDCVLDVGANTGQFAKGLRRAGYTGHIVSFEPVAHLLAALHRSAADDPHWRVLGYALGDEDGTAEINVVPGRMSSMLPASTFGMDWSQKLRSAHTETIEIRRLDSVFDEALAGLDVARVFLKMDTQGYDLATVRGAGDRLNEIVGLQSELSCVPIYDGMPRLPEQLQQYEADGFAISGFFPVTQHRRTLRAIELDVVMVRPGAVGAAKGETA